MTSPVNGSYARRYPSRVVLYTMLSATTGPVHKWSWCPPVRHNSFIGGTCVLGDNPARFALLWNVGHDSFGGATISITTRPVPDAEVFREDVPFTAVRWTVSSGAFAGTLTLTTIEALWRPGTSPTSGIPSPSVSDSSVTPSAL